MRWIALGCVLVGCGRIDFDLQHDGGTDGVVPDGVTPATLVDRDVLVRYFLDEADSGQAVLLAQDAIAPPFDLTLVYETPTDPHWGTLSTGRGLTFDAMGGDGGACRAVSDKLLNLNGATRATLEVRVAVSECHPEGSRLLHIGEGPNWTFALGCVDGQSIVFDYNVNPDDDTGWNVDMSAPVTLTLVFDTTQTFATDRVRLYADGVFVPIADRVGIPTQNEALEVATPQHLCIGNRQVGQRTPRGTISYAALYATALTDVEIATNVVRLAISDDR